jgi:hypothetical protein
MSVERIQNRRGTSEQWLLRNPILGSGEIGFEVNTGKFKMGDGTSTWSQLSYFETSDGIDIDLSNYYTKSQTDTNIGTAIAALVDSAPSTLDTLNEIATALGDDPNFATTIITELGDKADADSVNLALNAKANLAGPTFTGNVVLPATTTIGSVSSTELSYLDGVTSSIQTQIDGMSSSASMVYGTGTTYTLLASDANNIVSLNNASPITFTVNNVFSPGESTSVYKKGNGIITFSAGSGVTLEGAGISGVNLKLTNKFGAVTIFCERAGVYSIIGDVEIA